MAKYSYQEENSEARSKGPHRDAPDNIRSAKELVQRMEKHKPPQGVMLTISDMYLMISYNPGIGVKAPNYAVPISFHQPRADYSRQVEIALNGYIAHANAQLAKNPQQKLLDLSGPHYDGREAS